MKRLLLTTAAALALLTTAAQADINGPAHAGSLIGVIATARRVSVVCDKAEDVLRANFAWQQHKGLMDSCGLILAGKIALVRNEMKVTQTPPTLEKPLPPGTIFVTDSKVVCVSIYANVESAEHYANNADKCFWSDDSELGFDAEMAAQQGRRVGPAADRLFEGYWRYIFVKYCHDVRDGYLVKNINDAEMDRAEQAIKAIVDKAKADDASVDTDKQWNRAMDNVRRLNVPASIDWCQRAKNELFRLSPQPVFTVNKPE